jgi:hypothetical protein
MTASHCSIEHGLLLIYENVMQNVTPDILMVTQFPNLLILCCIIFGLWWVGLEKP